MATKVTESILEELEFKQEGNKWVHIKGTFIYNDKVPETLNDLVKILTGTAFKKGKNESKN